MTISKFWLDVCGEIMGVEEDGCVPIPFDD